MNKIKEFTQNERQEYSLLYFDLVNAADEINPFLSDKDQQERHFNNRIHLIKDYLDVLDVADAKADGNGFLELFKSDEKYKEQVLSKKRILKKDFDKLKLCHKCTCLSCPNPCPFKSCQACKSSYFTAHCDKNRYCIVSGLEPIKLYSHDENRDIYFNVLGLLKDNYSNQNYIYLSESTNPDNQHILEYVQYVNGTCDYHSLDADLLDKIYDLFVRFNHYE